MSFTIDRRRFLATSGGLAAASFPGIDIALAQGKALTIATSLPSLSFPFFVHMQKQLAAEAKTLGNINADRERWREQGAQANRRH